MKFVFECSARFLTGERSDWEEKFQIHAHPCLVLYIWPFSEDILSRFEDFRRYSKRPKDLRTFPNIFRKLSNRDCTSDCTSVKYCPSCFMNPRCGIWARKVSAHSRDCAFSLDTWHGGWNGIDRRGGGVQALLWEDHGGHENVTWIPYDCCGGWCCHR